jgi:acetyl esterase/lipase
LLSGKAITPAIAEQDEIPSLQVVYPENAKIKRAAVIVLPGGGYSHLAQHEGLPVAEWLARAGYTAFILRYRRGPAYPHPIPLEDGQRALRLVRSLIQSGTVNAQTVGVLGFSAGGHLASTLATHFTPEELLADPATKAKPLRPDFQILIYPVITLGPEGHARSRLNLLGEQPSADEINLLSNEKHITPETPPAFLFHSTEDQGVPSNNSDLYAASLHAATVPYKYVRGKFGPHGIGLHSSWAGACLDWLEDILPVISGS